MPIIRLPLPMAGPVVTKTRNRTFCTALLALAFATPSFAFDPVREDPPADAAHPARNQQVLVPSGGVGMNALLQLAAGAGRKPTVVLLHGFPGNEQNLDLAQAIRRSGWNVLTLHYRGSWGSPGKFSIAGAIADASAAVAFVHRDDVAEQYGIDTSRIVVGGHSMGGFVAARYVATHDDVVGLLLLDAWNIGADAQALRDGKYTQVDYEKNFDDLGNSLVGTNPEVVAREIRASGADWNLVRAAGRYAKLPVLTIWADRGIAKDNAALAAAIEGSDGHDLTARHFPADHAFVDFRLAVADLVVRWLDAREGNAKN